MVKKVGITVLKTTLDEKLTREYGTEGLTACPMMRQGQIFSADYAKPDGFCGEAWKAIYQYVFALSHGPAAMSFITATGSESPASPFAAATTACVPSSSSWRPRMKQMDYTPVR